MRFIIIVGENISYYDLMRADFDDDMSFDAARVRDALMAVFTPHFVTTGSRSAPCHYYMS